MIKKIRHTVNTFDRFSIHYDILMIILSIGVIINLILESKTNLSSSEISMIAIFDKGVWSIFIIDYIVRLLLANDRKSFIKQNIIDLIAIIPFDVFFQGFRSLRLLKLSYIIRCFAYLTRAYIRIKAILKTNSFDHVLKFTFIIIFLCSVLITYTEDMSFGDALWLSFVTTTTVGYGDIAPHSFLGRIVAAILMIVGIGFLSTLTGTISTFFMNATSRQDYKKDEINHIIEKLNNFKNLSIDDLNSIHNVLVALKKSEIHKN